MKIIFKYSLVSLLFFVHLLYAQTVTYSYDALGRVTFVTDSVNGNRDFDYDKAGNRLMVSVATANDQATEPGPPTAPTGVSAMTCCAMGVYKVSWNLVTGASYYNFALTKGNSVSLTTSPYYTPSTSDSTIKPYSLQACNDFGCSPKVYFNL